MFLRLVIEIVKPPFFDDCQRLTQKIKSSYFVYVFNRFACKFAFIFN